MGRDRHRLGDGRARRGQPPRPAPRLARAGAGAPLQAGWLHPHLLAARWLQLGRGAPLRGPDGRGRPGPSPDGPRHGRCGGLEQAARALRAPALPRAGARPGERRGAPRGDAGRGLPGRAARHPRLPRRPAQGGAVDDPRLRRHGGAPPGGRPARAGEPALARPGAPDHRRLPGAPLPRPAAARRGRLAVGRLRPAAGPERPRRARAHRPALPARRLLPGGRRRRHRRGCGGGGEGRRG